MMLKRLQRGSWLLGIIAFLAFRCAAFASEYRGEITFAGYPVPGATITASRDSKTFTTVSDQGGLYAFPDLADGQWKIAIAMQCFSTIDVDVTVSTKMPAAKWELKLLPADQIMAQSKLAPKPVVPLPQPVARKTASSDANAPEMPKPPAANDQAADGLLVNGSTNNAATSKFSLDQAFGNRRPNSRSLYTFGLAAIYDNSALDAKPYSLSGIDTPKPAYNRITGVFTFGGPINIPHVMPHGPNLFAAYQWTRDHDAVTESGLVPTEEERNGDLSGLPVSILNPATGQPFVNNIVPVSQQAQALLKLYPLPNISGDSLYNFQVPQLNSSHQDVMQMKLDKTLGRKDQLFGGWNLQSTRAGTTSLLGFTDTTDTLGINANVHWSHRFSQHLFLNTAYQFSRLRTQVVPYFENRTNVSGLAGITGNNQEPENWGPPSLNFSSGIAELSDGLSSFNRARTDAFSGSVAIYHGRHNITLGGNLRKQQFNDDFQANPRGVFTFTGAATAGSGATGSDLADFLIGIPDTSALAFGNADKYLREPVYDLYAADDWRVLPQLTINAGMRWEYGAPITEIHGRLVNLDIAPNFSAVAPVLGSDPVGTLTGTHYPGSLIRPDRRGFEPRIGISWRPIPASTIVVRAGYGIYDDTSVYQTAALQLVQQSPLSKSLSVANSAACPLTLADGFNPCSTTTSNTFAVDPNFRVGYAQTWQLSVQRDLPFALQMTATYLGIKGTNGVQQFLPNTYPIGGVDACPDCPSGFTYQTSGGASTRQSGQLQLRRRLRSGFAASLLYTYSKSIDDDAYLGGQGHVTATDSQNQSSDDSSSSTQGSSASTPSIAQNWLNLHAERALSSFDQRHLLKLQAQYTSGEGLGGGDLLSGWSGKLLKEWTVLTQISAGTGLPETPVYLAAVPGTGVTGTIRPDPTGASVYNAPAGFHLNAAAFTPPTSGQWGTAGRNSITGPGTFTLDGSLARTFRPSTRFYLDARIDATNLFNHGVFTSWNTTVNSTQFGLPLAANAMRSLQTTVRLRF